jgi:hypothetical protein
MQQCPFEKSSAFKTSCLLWKNVNLKVEGEGKDKAEGKFDPLHTMKAYETIKLQLHLVLDGGEW